MIWLYNIIVKGNTSSGLNTALTQTEDIPAYRLQRPCDTQELWHDPWYRTLLIGYCTDSTCRDWGLLSETDYNIRGCLQRQYGGRSAWRLLHYLAVIQYVCTAYTHCVCTDWIRFVPVIQGLFWQSGGLNSEQVMSEWEKGWDEMNIHNHSGARKDTSGERNRGRERNAHWETERGEPHERHLWVQDLSRNS